MHRRFMLALCSTGMLGSVMAVAAAPPRSAVWWLALGLGGLNVVGVILQVRDK